MNTVLTTAARPTWDQYIEQVGPYVFLLASQLAKSLRLEVEDTHQELLLTLFRTLPSYDPSRGAMTTWAAMKARWLYRWLHSRQARRAAHMRVVSAHDSESGHFLDLPDHRVPDPSAAPEQDDDAEKLHVALQALPSRTRRIIKARAGLIEGPATFEALAGNMGLTKERVRQLERQGLEKLAELMGTDPGRVVGLAKAGAERPVRELVTA